jgi:hypothetical protein
MSDPIRNAIARMNARAAPAEAPVRAIDQEELTSLRRLIGKLEQEKEDILATQRALRMAHAEEIAKLTADVASACAAKDAAELRCAEMQGRASAVVAPPAAPDSGAKYEALVSEFSDLRVEHGGCAAREEGLRQLITELRRQNDTLTAQIQACLTEDESEDESEDDTEETGGCEIDVVRGGDDRIRSLKVRYVK